MISIVQYNTMNSARIAKIRKLLETQEIGALLVSNYYNILYTTGFKTLTTDEREAFVLITQNFVYLFTDARYLHADAGVTLKLLEQGKPLGYHLAEITEKERIRKMGIESEDLRVHEYMVLKKLLSSVDIVLTKRLLIRLRAEKDSEEIKSLEKACEITDRCLETIIPKIKPGRSEKSIANGIDEWIRDIGYTSAFDPIVAVNEHSSIPHYNTKDGDGTVQTSSVILMDFGVEYQGYRSDITRIVFINPSDEMVTAYNSLLKVQIQSINAVRKVKDTKSIDQFCRSLYPQYHLALFSHSLGHGVGLEVHEYPKLSATSTDRFEDNQVFTIEPGVYYPGKWGMRIEDTVAYRNNQAVPLTKFTKDPIILKF